MLTEVHLHIEYKDESGEWQVEQCSTDYNRFNFLMVLVADLYKTVECKQSYPSFTLKQLQEYPLLDKMFSIINNEDKDKDKDKDKDDIYHYIKFYGQITFELKELAELHGGAENVRIRIVFFFDN